MDQAPEVKGEELREPTPEDVAKWEEKHGIKPAKDGWIDGLPDGKKPLEDDVLLANVATNALRHEIPNLKQCIYRSTTAVFIGGGPSAADYIDEIGRKAKDPRYDVYCSNATAAWLLEHGITPKFQVIIDPKPSKALDLAHGNDDITYLLGLQCDPSVFEAVKDRSKVFKFLASSTMTDGRKDSDAARAACIPTDPRLVIIGGGSMMGTRMLALCNPLGYRRLEYYGFDGSVITADYGREVQCYAYTKPRGEGIIEVEAEDGRKFLSTMTFARQADELNFFRKMLPWIDVTVHGDGFIAHMLELDRQYDQVDVPYRCSRAYQDLQREMAPNYEGAGAQYANRVYLIAAQLLKRLGAIEHLDYGAGKGALQTAMRENYAALTGLRMLAYNLDDPDPEPVELVTCTDVMEHVEPECVAAVLDHIRDLTTEVAFFAIDTQPAVKTLPDGRNAHICIREPQWWRGQLMKRFLILENYSRGGTVMFVCIPFPQEKANAPKPPHGSAGSA